MENYKPEDITSLAKSIVERFPVPVHQSPTYFLPSSSSSTALTTRNSPAAYPRIPVLPDFAAHPHARTMRKITTAKEETETSSIDLAGLDQLVEAGQAHHCAAVLRYMADSSQRFSIAEWADTLKRLFDHAGLDAIVPSSGWESGSLVRARELEILAVVNRVRRLTVEKEKEAAADVGEQMEM